MFDAERIAKMNRGRKPWLSPDHAPFYHPEHWGNEATHGGYRSILAAICASTEVVYFLQSHGAGDKIKKAANKYIDMARRNEVPTSVREDYSSTLSYGPPSHGFDVGRQLSWGLGSVTVERLLDGVVGHTCGPRWANRWGNSTTVSGASSISQGTTTATFTYRPPDLRRWRYNAWRASLPNDKHVWVVGLVLSEGENTSYIARMHAASYVFLYDGFDEREVVPALRRVMYFDPAMMKIEARSLAVDIAAARFMDYPSHRREMKKILDTVFAEDLYDDMQLHGAYAPYKEED